MIAPLLKATLYDGLPRPSQSQPPGSATALEGHRTEIPANGGRTARRGGFTLIELLVATMIIVVLASMALFTLAGVLETAKEARTRAQIARIHELLMAKYESYRTRPVPIRIPRGTPPKVAAQWRLAALYELMRMEMPDRFSDIADITHNSANIGAPVVLTSRPAVSRRYKRQVDNNNATRQFEQAECLYMILAAMNDEDVNGLEFFQESEIGDIDGDGFPEIHDGWGTPIAFLRWAPGFQSDLQSYFFDPETGAPTDRGQHNLDPLRSDARYDPDYSNDPNLRLDDPFPLFPFVFSAGPDGQFGIVVSDYDCTAQSPTFSDVFYNQTQTQDYNDPSPNCTNPITSNFPAAPWQNPYGNGTYTWQPGRDCRPPNDPYMLMPESRDLLGREFVGGQSQDNIHNHLRDIR